MTDGTRRGRPATGRPSQGADRPQLDPAAVRRLRNRLPGCLLSAGILVAPFVGLLYDVNLALGIAAVGLVAAAFLAWDARAIAPPEIRPRLRTVTIVNAILAVLVTVTLAARLLTDQAPGG